MSVKGIVVSDDGILLDKNMPSRRSMALQRHKQKLYKYCRELWGKKPDYLGFIIVFKWKRCHRLKFWVISKSFKWIKIENMVGSDLNCIEF